MTEGDVAAAVEAANARAVERMLAADPVLVDVAVAGDAIQGLGDRTILHAGPPIGWPDMCGPLKGAVAGAIVLEGWAENLDTAAELAAAGGVAFHPNHHFDAVGPMTGIVTRSMPVMVVENRAFGNRAYCTLNEGLGKVMRFGGNDAEVLARLRWLADTFGPAFGAALREAGGIPLKAMIARGLSMGDEMHQRNVGCTSLLLRALAPALARAVDDRERLAGLFEFIGGNDQFFLNVAMAMGKAIMDPVRGIEGSSVVTAMSRNGTMFGIRVSGLGDRWFAAPVEMPRGLYFPGFSEDDANPDIGDSTIVETVGLGGFAMAAAPAVAGFVGAGTAADALNYTRAMEEITVARNPEWTIPALDFAGVPTGIDIRKVVASGRTPTINTGIAHREAGIGQVGAGVVRAPMVCFERALEALAAEMGVA
ncbi:MAG: DUF1116 domain-containing protein [Defluviicoccus sp.]|nr:DUF1116 domain-containing protein [Defluviicoccus sp.]MDE0277770.1 DUF1116 domain-containing protein [Defluviicoccus sp.]